MWHLVLFSFKPVSLIFKKAFVKRSSCSCKVFPNATKSSWEFILPGMSEINEVTSLWRTSLAEWIQYGERLKRYLPEGIPNASKFELNLSTFTCQQPELAPSFEKYWHLGENLFGSREVKVLKFKSFVQRSWVETYAEFSVWFFNYYKSVNPVGWFLDRFSDMQVNHTF